MQRPPELTPHGEHLAFLEVLGSMRADDARWTPTMAGFVTVRLVDKWAESLRGWMSPRPSEISAVRGAIDKVPTGPVRNALSAIVDAVTQSWGRRRAQVSAQVLAYAALLYDRNEWVLSADIYRTFLSLAHTSEGDLIAQAWLRIGMCEVWLGHYPEAEAAHSCARALATVQGERYLELAAEHGLALITLKRGNLPKADERFAAVIAGCEQHLPEVPALGDVLVSALHDQGGAAAQRGDIERGFALLGRALEEARNQRQRDNILNDLAFTFMEMGLLDTARQAYLIVELTAENAITRSIALLNLMHIAMLDGAQTVFERHRQTLAGEALTPRLAVNYQIITGEGHRRFGRMPQARQALDRAIVLAERHQLHRELIEAETVRAALEKEPTPAQKRAEPLELGVATLRVQETIEQMSAELAGAGV